MVPRNIILEECGDDESDSSILWHTARSSGLPRGVLTCMYQVLRLYARRLQSSQHYIPRGRTIIRIESVLFFG